MLSGSEIRTIVDNPLEGEKQRRCKLWVEKIVKMSDRKNKKGKQNLEQNKKQTPARRKARSEIPVPITVPAAKAPSKVHTPARPEIPFVPKPNALPLIGLHPLENVAHEARPYALKSAMFTIKRKVGQCEVYYYTVAPSTLPNIEIYADTEFAEIYINYLKALNKNTKAGLRRLMQAEPIENKNGKYYFLVFGNTDRTLEKEFKNMYNTNLPASFPTTEFRSFVREIMQTVAWVHSQNLGKMLINFFLKKIFIYYKLQC